MNSKGKLIVASVIVCIVIWFLFSGSSVPQLPALPANATVLAFGDSLTFGVGTEADKSYPTQLAKLTNLNVIREGVPGEISADGLKRLPALLEQHQPTLLLLCHGGNDFLQKKDLAKTEKNIEAMIKMARDKNISVVLIGVPKASITLSPPFFYRKLADKYKLPYDDSTISKIIVSADLKSDQVHPNEDGYKLIAERIHKLLQKAGAID